MGKKNQITEVKNNNHDLVSKVYDQTIDAHERSITILKWSLGIVIFINISSIIGSFLYFSSIDRNEYERALSDILQYRKEIREYRDEARSFVDEKIKPEGQAVIQSIQEKGFEAINTFGAKSQEGMKKLERQLFEQTEFISLWMYSIIDENNDTKLSYLESLEKKKPDDWGVYYAKGSVYYSKYSKLEENGKGSEQIKQELLIEAQKNSIKSYNLKPSYCIGYIILTCSLLNQEEECQKWLERNLKDKSLPYQVVEDNYQYWTSLEKYQSKDWYKIIVNEWRNPSK